MKRLILPILLLLIVLTLPPVSAATPVTALPEGEQLQSKSLIVGVPKDFPPYYFINKNNQNDGYAIDVFNQLAKKMGLKPEYRTYETWFSTLHALKSNEIDLIPNIGITESRQAFTLFTDPVETFRVSFFVRTTDSIRSVDDIGERSIAVLKGNVAEKKLANRKDLNLKKYNVFSEALFDLITGKVDVLAYPETVVKRALKDAGLEDRLVALTPSIAEIKRAIGISSKQPELHARIDAAVKKYVGSKQFQAIYTKWFGKPESFWTAELVFWTMLIISILIIMAIFIHRYFLLTRMAKRMQQESEGLRQAEDRYRLLFEASADAIMLLGKDHFITCNQAALDLFGCPDKETFQRLSPSDLSPPRQPGGLDSMSAARSKVEQALKKGSVLFEWVHWHYETHKKFTADVLLSAVVVDKQPVVLSVVRDVSARAEKEKQMLAARQASEQASEEKSRFLANISHELRTPMHAVMSFSSLGLKHAENEKVKSYLEKIHISGERLTVLLNDLLDLSKLETGEQTLDFAENNLTAIALESIDELSGLAKEKNILIEINDDKTCFGNFDAKSIQQVIINLLSNAIKFSPPESEIRIHLSEQNRKDQSRLVFSITDQGIGIPEDEINDVFNSFVQSSKTRSTSEGTGLGLPISREIISLHNGRIWAVSPPKDKAAGSEFIFEIPVNRLGQ